MWIKLTCSSFRFFLAKVDWAEQYVFFSLGKIVPLKFIRFVDAENDHNKCSSGTLGIILKMKWSTCFSGEKKTRAVTTPNKSHIFEEKNEQQKISQAFLPSLFV